MKKQLLLDLAQQSDKTEVPIDNRNDYKHKTERFALALDDAQLGLHRVVDIVHNMTMFHEIEADQKEFCDLNDCINEVYSSLNRRAKLPTNTRLALTQLPSIKISESKIKQVLTHLLINASQATDKNGEIIVSSTFSSSSIIISVSDNGCGIPDSDLEKVFDLFYTTKKSSDGTGLGLAISFAFIEEHLGKLEVTSEQGKGSTFTMSLPVSQKILH